MHKIKDQPPVEFLPAPHVRARYAITEMTLHRWLRNGALQFPSPIRINQRRYWRLRDLEAWERARVAGKHMEVT